jgi:tape measure domain-containing protein
MAVQVGQISTQLTADVANFTSGMRSAQQTFGKTVSTIQTGSKQATASLQTIAQSVQGLQGTFQRSMGIIGAGFILPKIFMKAKSAIIDFNQTLDQSTIAMTHFAGGAEEADELLGTLQDFAARTPFNFQDLLGTTQQMMAMGVQAEELLPRLTAIGDAAAGLGGSPEILQRITRALGQIQAKGRVQAEELMQLAEVGVPAYQYMGEVVGGDIPKALDMMRKGEIDAATAISALLDGLTRDFSGMMESQSKTMMGAMSTVEDFVQMTVAAIGRPIFDSLRETMLKVAEFLSSKEIQKGAENLAKNIANGMKQAGEIIGKILKTIGPVIESLIGNIYDFARAVGNGIGGMKPVILAVVGAFMAVVGAVKVLSAILTPVLQLFAENKTLAQSLVIVLGVLAVKQKLFGTNSEGAAKAGTAFMASLRANIAGAKEYIQTMQRFAAMNGTTLTTMQALRVGVTTGFKAMAASAKAFMASVAPMLAMVIAIELIVKAFEAFGAKQKVTDERTKELTQSIKDQTVALLENREALEGGADGANILHDAIFKTGEESDKLVRAFGVMGRAASVDQMKLAAADFEEYATQILMAQGMAEEAARQTAKNINETDANDFTGSAYDETAEALEFLQDTLENIDFTKLAEQQGQALVGAGKLTTAQLLQAQTMTEAMPGYDLMSDDLKGIALNQNILTVATDGARKAIEDEAKATAIAQGIAQQYSLNLDGVTNTRKKAIDMLREMNAASKDGVASFEDFNAAINGSKDGLIQYKRFMSSFNKSMEKMFDDIALGEGVFADLELASFDLSDGIAEMIYNADALGMSQDDVNTRTVEMIAQFARAAEQAGFEKDQIDQLINSLGILDNLDPTIKIYTDVTAAKEDLNKLLEALSRVAMIGGDTSGLTLLVQRAQKAINALTAPKRTGGGSGGGSSEPENPFAWVEDWIEDIKSFASDYTSEDFAFSLLNSTPEELGMAIVQLLEDAEAIAIRNAPNSKAFFDRVSELGSQLVGLADERERIAIRLEKANELLADAISARDSVASSVSSGILGMGQLDWRFISSPANIKGSLQDAISKAKEYKSVIQQRGFPRFMIEQVIAGGPFDGTLLGKAFLDSSISDVETYKQLGSELEAIAIDAGSVAGDILFGGDIANISSVIGALDTTMIDLNGTIGLLINKLQGNVAGGVGGVGVASSSPMNVVINMPYGSDGEDVVQALQSYQRRNGTIPINTRSV